MTIPAADGRARGFIETVRTSLGGLVKEAVRASKTISHRRLWAMAAALVLA
jgi:hypothetical protein